MRSTKFFMAFLLASLVTTATDAAAQDTIYRWVDEDGVVHYTDQPNDKAGSEIVSIRDEDIDSSEASAAPAEASDAQPQGPSVAQQRREARAEKRRQAAEQQAAIDEGCAQRRQLVASLEPSPRVMVENEDGTVTRMDDNARLEMLAEAKAYIAEKCNK